MTVSPAEPRIVTFGYSDDEAFAALAPLSQGVMDVRLTW